MGGRAVRRVLREEKEGVLSTGGRALEEEEEEEEGPLSCCCCCCGLPRPEPDKGSPIIWAVRSRTSCEGRSGLGGVDGWLVLPSIVAMV